MQLSNYQN